MIFMVMDFTQVSLILKNAHKKDTIHIQIFFVHICLDIFLTKEYSHNSCAWQTHTIEI